MTHRASAAGTNSPWGADIAEELGSRVGISPDLALRVLDLRHDALAQQSAPVGRRKKQCASCISDWWMRLGAAALSVRAHLQKKRSESTVAGGCIRGQ